MEKLKVLDLFAGIGGFSAGLEKAGMETVAFCEKDIHCRKVLKKHWPKIPIFKDIKGISVNADYFMPIEGFPPIHGHYGCINYLRDYEEKEIKIPLHCGFSDIEILTGGFPCTDISFAGNREGIKGKNSSLWKEYLRLIKEVRPKYAIIENVEYLRKNGLGVVLNDLARIGYDAEWHCFTARSFGYPHQRKRLFIVSYPSSKRFNEHTGEKRHLQIDKEWKDKKMDQEGNECKSEFIQVCKVFSQRGFKDFKDSKTNKGASVSKLRRVINGVLKRLDENRRKQRIKQLGNSIVPDIAEYIGREIIKCENSR